MKGIELSRRYYEEFGKKAMRDAIGDDVRRVAFGLVGEGSECLGYDDETSTDHDFEPGFCMWITKEDYEKLGFKLELAYSKLPKEFLGYTRRTITGSNRRGLKIIDAFYDRFLGIPRAPTTPEEWLFLPDECLATATNGEVFCDELGEFTKIRNTLLNGYPLSVKLKKIAAHLIMLQQTGLYNYQRCIKRGENGAAQLCVFEFVNHASALIFLINNCYQPFYKWRYRKMRELSVLGKLEASLVSLTELGNTELEVSAKSESMEEIARAIIDELVNEGITTASGYDLEQHAILIQDKIKNANLRNMHILTGI